MPAKGTVLMTSVTDHRRGQRPQDLITLPHTRVDTHVLDGRPYQWTAGHRNQPQGVGEPSEARDQTRRCLSSHIVIGGNLKPHARCGACCHDLHDGADITTSPLSINSGTPAWRSLDGSRYRPAVVLVQQLQLCLVSGEHTDGQGGYAMAPTRGKSRTNSRLTMS